jgi:ElaB/YqjD/DUF883 family membrane-anchored ribosome-binding protein
MEQVSTDKLLRDLKVVVEDAEALLSATAGQTGEKIEHLRARAKESLAAARERLKVAGAEIGAKARAAAKSTDDYVHDNPWTAIVIAAGLGFLIGSLSNRR